MRFANWLLACVFALTVSGTAIATDGAVGVVVLHGKWGSNRGDMSGLAEYLKREGFLVEAPNMPWSGQREYEVDMDGAMKEIDAAVDALRKAGARKIVIAGHSMGANAALHYSGRTQVDGVVSAALGHYPESRTARASSGASVAKAREMVQAGKGDERAEFEDFNSGNRFKKVRCPAKSYLSYFDPDGPMNALNNARNVKPGTPVLWIVGTREAEGPRRLGDRAHAALPENPRSKFVEVSADHRGTPDAAKSEIAQWLKAL